ncbi:TLC domain-containing protein 4-like isoform X2 [Branchiostoma floridae]|uniref:TLC domain-containing protein 4-like isoform X2 n=1 Tax=Branchiostoma floridae TaxID=7739 RepID=A0A9J7N170_BRAFL|nr:TLC domain-containing protein 4-like isoform X2 [Branchiostoma floridae]
MAFSSYHIMTIVASFFSHLAIFKWLAPWMLRKASPVFATLPLDKQIVTRNRVMSAFHGAVTGGMGLYVFLYPGEAIPTQIWHDSPAFRHATCIIMGYAQADTLLMLFNTCLQDRLMIVHHAIACIAAYAGSVIPALPYYGNFWVLMELSSPFVNLRMILYSLGQERSRLYLLNGILMLVTFFTCRVMTIPLWFQLAEPMATGELYEIGPLLFFTIVVLTPIIYGMNIYWFGKMCSKSYQHLYHTLFSNYWL